MKGPSARRKVKNPTLKAKRKSQKKFFKPKNAVLPIMAKVWDKNRTVQQNYQTIGLTSNINTKSIPNQQSMLIHPSIPSLLTETGKRIPLTDMAATMYSGVVLQAAKVTRDTNNEVIGYEVEDDFLNPMENSFDKALSKVQKGVPVSKTVQDLIHLARHPLRRINFPAAGKLDWMHKLVIEHGDDVVAMAKDYKLNPYQHTPAQLARKLKNYWTFIRNFDVNDVSLLTR